MNSNESGIETKKIKLMNEVKIFENGIELTINSDNFKEIISLLKKKIEEAEKFDKLCFFIASSTNCEVVYWYCNDSENALYYADIIKKKVDKYCAETDHIEDLYRVISGYLNEQKIFDYVAGNLGKDLRCNYNYNLIFEVKKLDTKIFSDLPNKLSKRQISNTYFRMPLQRPLQRNIDWFIENIKHKQANGDSSDEDEDEDEGEDEDEVEHEEEEDGESTDQYESGNETESENEINFIN